MASFKLSALLILALLATTAFAWSPARMEMEEEEMMEQPEEQADMDRAGDDDDWFHFRADANATGGGGQQVHGQSGLMPQMVLQKAMDSQAGHKQGSTNRPCSPAGKCFSHDDCGAKGRCLGLAVGTCDCAACGQGFLCNIGAVIGQRQCGGLQNACNTTTNLCDCNSGYKQAGFKDMGDAFLQFCNKQSCNGREDSCHGLPCHSGFCAC